MNTAMDTDPMEDSTASAESDLRDWQNLHLVVLASDESDDLDDDDFDDEFDDDFEEEDDDELDDDDADIEVAPANDDDEEEIDGEAEFDDE
jgi:hypothetical protein